MLLNSFPHLWEVVLESFFFDWDLISVTGDSIIKCEKHLLVLGQKVNLQNILCGACVVSKVTRKKCLVCLGFLCGKN